MMRAPAIPLAAMAPDLHALHDEMSWFRNVSLLLNACDMSLPGCEERLPDDVEDRA